MVASSFLPRRDLSRGRYSVSQKVVSQDEAINRIQSNQERFTNDSVLKSNQIDDILVTTSGVNINHKLGKEYSGFNVIKNSSNANIYIDSTDESNKNKNNFIRLKSSSDTTISITVF